MSSETKFAGNRYEIVAWANDQESLYYREFGSYQGEWILLSFANDTYFIYKGSYGSCGGCDSFESEFSYSETEDGISKEQAKKFAEPYKTFAKVPKKAMISMCNQGKVSQLFPANIRDTYGEINYEEAIEEITILVKLFEKLSVSWEEVKGIQNAELKQKALRYYGYEEFVKDAKATVIHEDVPNYLLKVDDILFLSLKDSSTDRRYLLRVPPETKTVRQGLSWTFFMSEEQYHPLVET